jgi:large subunit ribosomal protein L23
MSKLHPSQIVRRPLVSEKGMAGIEKDNCYPFEVDDRADKAQIKDAIESLFKDVKVVKVRTMNRRGKPRSVRLRAGRTPDTKKAVVTLREGDRIEFI